MSFHRILLRSLRSSKSCGAMAYAAAAAALEPRLPAAAYVPTRTSTFSSSPFTLRLRDVRQICMLPQDRNHPEYILHKRVMSLIHAGDLDAASSTARHAVLSGDARPSVHTCNAVTEAMYLADRFEDALTLFQFFFEESGIVPNVVSYNHLIAVFCKTGQVDDAIDVYRQMLANASFLPSVFTYRHLTRALVGANRIEEAMCFLRDMPSRLGNWDPAVYSHLIAGFFDLGNMEKALELFDELKDYYGETHATLMECYSKKGMDKEAMKSYHSQVDPRLLEMNAVDGNSLLKVLLKHEKWEEAETVFEHMLSNHRPPSFIALDDDTYIIMVNDCFKRGKPAEAMEIFHRTGERALKKSLKPYNNIIGKLCENGLLSDAEKLYEDMIHRNCIDAKHCFFGGLRPDNFFVISLAQPIPDAATYGFLIDACFKEGRVEDALSYFDKMLSQHWPPVVNVGFYYKMFERLVHAGKVDEATKMFGKMRERERGLDPDPLS